MKTKKDFLTDWATQDPEKWTNYLNMPGRVEDIYEDQGLACSVEYVYAQRYGKANSNMVRLQTFMKIVYGFEPHETRAITGFNDTSRSFEQAYQRISEYVDGLSS